MSDRGKSYRQILRATSIIGGASIINIFIGLLRIKAAAVLLGPTGVGLIGLMTSLAGTASTVAGLGFGNVGTRQIAAAIGKSDAAAVAAARRALFWGTLALSILGATIFWTLRHMLAERVLGSALFSSEAGWLALAVGLTVASASQVALLNGMRRVGDVAQVSVLSSLFATALGVGALLIWGHSGVMIFVLAAPLASFLVGNIYVARLPTLRAPRTPLIEMAGQWQTLARLGFAFMAAGLAGTLGQLLVRMVVQKNFGSDALGYFHAAYTISVTYVALVLGSMASDYYPRVAAAIDDHAAVNRIINEQTEVVLLLVGPMFIIIMALAPWIIEVLYAQNFQEEAVVLRLQIMGDILKVCSWPLGIVIIASGQGRVFMGAELIANVVYVLSTWLLLPIFGLAATGIAFFGMYLVYLPLTYFLAARSVRIFWRHRIFTQLTIILILAIFVFMIASWSKWYGAGLGATASILMAAQGLARIEKMTNLGGTLGCIAKFAQKWLKKIGIRHE